MLHDSQEFHEDFQRRLKKSMEERFKGGVDSHKLGKQPEDSTPNKSKSSPTSEGE